eukprot:scaffold395_cov243-Pinguiococcus_pyrenoidosus.AAC.17
MISSLAWSAQLVGQASLGGDSSMLADIASELRRTLLLLYLGRSFPATEWSGRGLSQLIYAEAPLTLRRDEPFSPKDSGPLGGKGIRDLSDGGGSPPTPGVSGVRGPPAWLHDFPLRAEDFLTRALAIQDALEERAPASGGAAQIPLAISVDFTAARDAKDPSKGGKGFEPNRSDSAGPAGPSGPAEAPDESGDDTKGTAAALAYGQYAWETAALVIAFAEKSARKTLKKWQRSMKRLARFMGT